MEHAVSLHEYLRHAQALDEPAFLERYPFPFLVPMGLEKAILLPIADHTPLLVRDEVMPHVGPHPLAGRLFRLAPREGVDVKALLAVGRAPDNDLVLPDPSVSEHHATLAAGEHTVTIRDLGSRNGTTIDDRPLRAHRATPVADQAILAFARYRFQLLFPGTFRDLARQVATLTPVR